VRVREGWLNPRNPDASIAREDRVRELAARHGFTVLFEGVA
jgi:hypothetical protein